MEPEEKTITPRTFHDPLFNETRLADSFLSVQIGEWGFSYAVLDGQSQTYIALGDLKTREKKELPVPHQPLKPDVLLTHVLQAFPWIKKPFRSTRVIWEGEKHTLIPQHLFEDSAASEILAFNTAVEAADQVFTDQLPAFSARNIFAIPTVAMEGIRRTWRVNAVVHHTSVLVSGIEQLYRDQLTKPGIFLNIREGHFDVVVMDHTSLLFLNSFVYRQPEDVVYFTLFSLDQLGIRPDQAEVVLMGAIQKNTPLFVFISKYIRKVDFTERGGQISLSHAIQRVSGHGFFSLLHLNSCGL